MDLAKEVDHRQREPTSWTVPGCLGSEDRQPRRLPKLAEQPYHVVAYDFGVKRNILRMLVQSRLQA